MAYALDRRVLFTPFCQQGDDASCTSFDQMFDLSKIRSILPAFALDSFPESSDCPSYNTNLIGHYDQESVNLEYISTNPVSSDRRMLCYQPPWISTFFNKCTSSWRHSPSHLQVPYMAMHALFQPANKAQERVTHQVSKFDGPFIAVHVRRSQSFLEYDEMKAWSEGWPATNLQMEEIMPLIENLLLRYEEAGRRVFLATNSDNATEIMLLQNHFVLEHYISDNVTPHMGIHVDTLVASKALVFLGTPGSTFTETIIQDHLLNRGHTNDIFTMCSIGESFPDTSNTQRPAAHACSNSVPLPVRDLS